MKKLLIIFSLIFTLNAFSQDLSKYNYVVVPEQFSFLKEADQYQLNSLTKFLFKKYGFETFMEGEEAYTNLSPDRCKGLYADVINDSGLFRTKLQVTLKDCRNQQVFISREGVSRQKDYGTAYQEALRGAFKSIEDLDYENNEVIVSGATDLKQRIEVIESVVEEPNAEVKQTVVQTSQERDVKNSDPVSVERKSEKEKLQPSQENNIERSSEIKISENSPRDYAMNYTRDGRKYFLRKTNNGFNMFQEGMTEPFATLISSSTGDKFVYSSMTSKGMAHRDNDGNLIIEILKEDNS